MISAPRLRGEVENLSRNLQRAVKSEDYSATEIFVQRYNEYLLTAKKAWPLGYLERLKPVTPLSGSEFGMLKQKCREVLNACADLASFLKTK